ncbi:MAG: YraN family protein [Clostridia bacterium]|nr:YraN family protein [Clostridia bacterium]
MSAKNISGKFGEMYASKYLEQNGYKIIRRNYKTRFSEIDIVAKDGEVLCFVEVKTRKNKEFGLGLEAVDSNKRDKMILGARSYMASYSPSCDIRFDVVEVYGEVLHSGFLVSEVNLIKNAFCVD